MNHGNGDLKENTNRESMQSYLKGLNDSEERASLLSQIENIDFEHLEKSFKERLLSSSDKIDDDIGPPKDDICGSYKDLETQPHLKDEYTKLAYQSIANGKVAVLLLAGGQGTRLGVSYPKGMYKVNLPSGKTLYQIQAERLISACNLVKKAVGGEPVIPWYIMTSEHTKDRTEEFFESHNYFNYDRKNVIFFEQYTIPCVDFDGKIIMETPSLIAKAPDGNGGLYRTLREKHLLDDMKKRGVESIQVYCVDNILVRIPDPVFIGFCLQNQFECAAKVVEKEIPSEPIGVVALLKNHYKVVEYSEISAATASALANGGCYDPNSAQSQKLLYRSGSICIHFFSKTFLDKVSDPTYERLLPYHTAIKKIPYWDSASSKTVTPKEPNGIKLEKFVFDVFTFAEKFGIWEASRDEEFAPLKNGPGAKSDCPESCQKALLNYCLKLAVNAGAKVKKDTIVEISPLTSNNGENLEFLTNESLEGVNYIHKDEASGVNKVEKIGEWTY